MEQIGNMTLTRCRLYDGPNGDDVVVEPGTFPVFDDNGTVFWLMPAYDGLKHEAHVERLGGGMFSLTPESYEPVGESYEFKSRLFDRADFESTDWPEDTSGALIYEAL